MKYLPWDYTEEQALVIEEKLLEMGLDVEVYENNPEDDQFFIGYNGNHYGMSENEFEGYVISTLIKKLIK